MVIVRRHQAPD